ncbi:MAG: NAD-dependent epimerase/dehydratase family protein, partial [Chloroflexi bacterium]|nr:NAD-dependent epimerase/dehydratase family protein [Chloroflexota bacterium]
MAQMTPLAGQTVLVTGATGFVGGALTLQLARDGVRVRALARSPEKGAFLRQSDHAHLIEIVLGDVTDADRMHEVAAGCAVVFHVAAALRGPYADQRRVNVDGTRHVVQAAADGGARRIVHISSVAVYGYGHRADVCEDTPPRPVHDPYVRSKREGERVVRDVGAERGLSYCILRPGAIYGPRSGFWT